MFHYYAEEQFKNDEMIAIKRITDNRDEQIHDHDFIELVYVVEGKGKHYINGEEYSVECGNLLFVNYGCTHSFTVIDNFVAYNLMIKLNYFTDAKLNEKNLLYILSLTSLDKLQEKLNKSSPLIFFDYDEQKEIVSLFKNLESELSTKELARSLIIDSYVNILLGKVFRKVFATSKEKDMFVSKKVADYIKSNLNNKLTLGDVASKYYYNPAYFSRLFKKIHKRSFTDYVMELRLEQSAALLRNTDKTIESIIEECGFMDRNIFFERFKKKYGCTPKEYKLKN